MQIKRVTGPEAGVLKYDLLTALSVVGLHGTPTVQTTCMRLIALVTARYNWREDELCVGQRDMARMWSVNERTVKREVKRFVEGGFLIQKRGGVKGRVGAYRLDFQRIAELSRANWWMVGPDYDARMSTRYTRDNSTVVPLVPKTTVAAGPSGAGLKPGTWQAAMARLADEHPEIYNAWFAQVSFGAFEKGVLYLNARSRFVARYIETHHTPLLLRLVDAELGPVDAISFAEPSSS